MSLFNSYDRTNFLGELNTPLESQGQGVFTPAQQRAKVLANLFGAAYDATVQLSPMVAASGVGQIFTTVPTVASGGTLAVHVTDVMTHSIRIQSVAGTKYYIMATTTVTNRTGGA